VHGRRDVVVEKRFVIRLNTSLDDLKKVIEQLPTGTLEGNIEQASDKIYLLLKDQDTKKEEKRES
jgi:hypothetical protein